MEKINNKIDLINYKQLGEGSALFFIHGLGANSFMFEPQIEKFSENYHVICPDLRGNGLSPKLKGPVNTILDRQRKDILDLMDSLEIEKAVFSGVSYGGVFCFHFALTYPDRVTGLIISDSFSDTKIHNITDFFIMFSTYISLPLLYFPKMLKPLVESQYKRWPLAQKHMVMIFRDLRSREVILQRLAINRANHTKKLNALNCPVLGMVGDESKILIKYMERAMASIENSQLIILNNSFDPSNLCAEEQYNDLTSQFLLKLEN